MNISETLEQQFGLTVLYEQGPCIVLCKPGGLLTQAPPHIDSLERRIKAYIKQRDSKPGRVYLGVPHRLDRPVSGVIVVARHVRAARRISEQFAGRTVQKTYWAFVQGDVQPDEGTWRDSMRKIPGLARSEVVDADHEGAQDAVLHYRVRYRNESGSWLEITLETGRTHQIRLQAATRGYPILGDAMYGSIEPFCELHAEERQRKIALHGRQLTFRHPMTREVVSISATLPAEWDKLKLPLETQKTPANEC